MPASSIVMSLDRKLSLHQDKNERDFEQPIVFGVPGSFSNVSLRWLTPVTTRRNEFLLSMAT